MTVSGGVGSDCMHDERYPGERRGLRLFLEGLLDAVDAELGRDAILYHRIRTALQRRDLASLRTARQMFNHQDTALKRRLSVARRDRSATPLSSARAQDADAGSGSGAGGGSSSAAIVSLPSPTRGDAGD